MLKRRKNQRYAASRNVLWRIAYALNMTAKNVEINVLERIHMPST